jgi:hypothetical protein
MRLGRRIVYQGVCFGVVLATRVGLWTMRYQALRRWLVKPCVAVPDPARRDVVMYTVRFVGGAGRFIPDASCLTQTIAAQAILSWRGVPSTIRVGARKDAAGTVHWHAWLIWNDIVVLQGNEESLAGFGTLLDLPTPDPGATAP